MLNALNRGGTDFKDLLVDGVAGPATASSLRTFLRLRGAAGRMAVLRYLDALQGARYIDLAEGREANEAFVLGWALRLGTFQLDLKAAA